MTSSAPFNSFPVVDALRAPGSFVARAAELVLAKYPAWAKFAVVQVKPRPQIVFTLKSPADPANKLMLEIGPEEEATLIFGGWHAHSNAGFRTNPFTDENIAGMMEDLMDSIERILDGTALAIEESKNGRWSSSYLASRDDLPTPGAGESIRVTSWLGMTKTELVVGPPVPEGPSKEKVDVEPWDRRTIRG